MGGKGKVPSSCLLSAEREPLLGQNPEPEGLRDPPAEPEPEEPPLLLENDISNICRVFASITSNKYFQESQEFRAKLQLWKPAAPSAAPPGVQAGGYIAMATAALKVRGQPGERGPVKRREPVKPSFYLSISQFAARIRRDAGDAKQFPTRTAGGANFSWWVCLPLQSHFWLKIGYVTQAQ